MPTDNGTAPEGESEPSERHHQDDTEPGKAGVGVHCTAITGYAAAAPIYWERGWRGVIPVDPADKAGVPQGFTGNDGIDVTPENLQWFATSKPGYNISLRLPADVIGIDVDDHSGKTGGQTLE